MKTILAIAAAFCFGLVAEYYAAFGFLPPRVIPGPVQYVHVPVQYVRVAGPTVYVKVPEHKSCPQPSCTELHVITHDDGPLVKVCD